jgi:protein O-GlcNAc transferase
VAELVAAEWEFEFTMPSRMTLVQQLQSGLAHHQAGRRAEAEGIYRQVLAQQPDNADALHLLGMLAGERGELDAAEDLIRRSIGLKPDSTEAHNNLGLVLAAKGRLDEAVDCYRQAVWVRPDFAEAHAKLANLLKNMGRLDEAIESYRQIVRLKPDAAEGHANLGTALRDKRQLDAAIASYRRAIELKPDFALAHGNLANVLAEVGQFDDAIASYRQAMSLKADNAVAHSNLILLMNFHPGYDAGMIFDELGRWNRLHAEPFKKLIRRLDNTRDPDRRLRIGYVSPDFRDHVIGRNVLPLMREHDHTQMEIFCYADVPGPDALTGQFKAYADAWRPIAGLSNTQVADLVRKDGIDILVDLSVHTGNNRLLVFAQKPTPVQVTFAGYPGSTGLDAIDYRLTDPYLDPPGMSDQFYSEKSVRLPDSFWCYDPAPAELAVAAAPALTNGYVTFGCLNNFCKVNQQVVQLWARVLNTVDRSRFMLLCPEGSAGQAIREMLEREGILSDRIELVSNRPRRRYFELYQRIDVGLDTFPYNGHTTSLDSYWMGVPVVTLVGKTVVGRAGLSQLTNLGLTELIAHTPQEYVQIAAGLATDLPRLAELRRTLRSRMQASPLTDAPKFARNIESAYRQMWRNWCAEGTA